MNNTTQNDKIRECFVDIFGIFVLKNVQLEFFMTKTKRCVEV
jgi:hypothetical protein